MMARCVLYSQLTSHVGLECVGVDSIYGQCCMLPNAISTLPMCWLFDVGYTVLCCVLVVSCVASLYVLYIS